jgi:hypothetical protein
MKSAVFWDVAPCGSCKNLLFGGTYRLRHQGDKNRRVGIALAVTSNRSKLLEAIGSYEMLVLTKAIRVTSQQTAFFILITINTGNLPNTSQKFALYDVLNV